MKVQILNEKSYKLSRQHGDPVAEFPAYEDPKHFLMIYLEYEDEDPNDEETWTLVMNYSNDFIYSREFCTKTVSNNVFTKLINYIDKNQPDLPKDLDKIARQFVMERD